MQLTTQDPLCQESSLQLASRITYYLQLLPEDLGRCKLKSSICILIRTTCESVACTGLVIFTKLAVLVILGWNLKVLHNENTFNMKTTDPSLSLVPRKKHEIFPIFWLIKYCWIRLRSKGQPSVSFKSVFVCYERIFFCLYYVTQHLLFPTSYFSPLYLSTCNDGTECPWYLSRSVHAKCHVELVRIM